MALDKKIMERLVEVVGKDNCSDEDFVVQVYAKSLDSVSGRQAPAAVVIPGSTEEVSGIVKIANEFKTPILPRGSGADLTMGAKPTKDGVILLDLNKRMNKILNIDIDHGVATVETGVQWGQLITALLSQGYYTGQFGPANSATTIGGGIANASVGGGGETMFAGPGRLVTSLEVVLPTGEIINTGSAANPNGKPWFGGRFLGGPDLTGMFIGDPGVLGIKTKVSLQIFPMPQFWKCKTYQVFGDNRSGTEGEKIDLLKDIRVAVEICKDWEKIGNPGIHSIAYFNYGCFNSMAGAEYYEPWTRALEPGKINQNGAMAMIMCAASQEALDANLKLVDEVCEKHGCKLFGDAIEEGNYAEWLLWNSGNWSYAHWFWGGAAGPGAAFNILDVQWDGLVKGLEEDFKVYEDRLVDYQDSNMPLPAIILSPVGGGVKLVSGCPTRDEIPELPDAEATRFDLRMEDARCILDQGGMPIWTGPLYSQYMVEKGYYDENYLKFFKSIKDTLDPNGILSPGKFHFND